MEDDSGEGEGPKVRTGALLSAEDPVLCLFSWHQINTADDFSILALLCWLQPVTVFGAARRAETRKFEVVLQQRKLLTTAIRFSKAQQPKTLCTRVGVFLSDKHPRKKHTSTAQTPSLEQRSRLHPSSLPSPKATTINSSQNNTPPSPKSNNPPH